MIYFDSRPVLSLGEDEITLTDSTVIGGINAPDLLTDESQGQEIFSAPLNVVRQKRNRLLNESDWTQLMDNVLSANLLRDWRAYRQALRDLPSTLTAENITRFTWPTPPAEG